MNFKNINYLGTFALDKIPKVFYKQCKKDNMKACICNTQTSTEGGAHWILLIKGQDGKTYNYDSFFRPTHNINDSRNEKYLNVNDFPKEWIEPKTNNKIMQNFNEINCGHRAISYLATINEYGLNHVFNNFI